MQKSFNIKNKKFDVWPKNLDVIRLNDYPPMFYTTFKDFEDIKAPLVQRALELEKDPAFTHRMVIGGSKVARVHDWGIPEANLLHARALEFFCKGVDNPNVKINACWASISRKHEYLSPHAHHRSLGSVVYMLQEGDRIEGREFDGNLAFLDPRIPACCTIDEDCPTQEVAPNMVEGAMVLFPSNLIHYVHPYSGDTPRITIAWDLYV